MTTAIERLEQLLDTQEQELSKVREERDHLKRELEGTLEGKFRQVEPEDGVLPVPRLELAYTQVDGWSHFRVTYQMVLRHLCGQLYALVIGSTDIAGHSKDPPDELASPRYDTNHAAHDSAYLGYPVYRRIPGKDPALLNLDYYAHQRAKGLAHRGEDHR